MRMPAAIVTTTVAGSSGSERLHGAAHLLRLHRQDERVGRRESRPRGVPHRHAEARGERLARALARLDDGDVRGGKAPRDQPADDGRAHVAAAEEGDLHAGFQARASRAPKIAVPMRSIVAPSASAARQSCDMPMERVSPSSPAARIASSSRRRTANSLPRLRLVARGARHAHEAAEAQAGQRRDVPREGERLAGLDAPLGRLLADVDLDAHVEGRLARRAVPREDLGELRAVDAVHPVEMLRHVPRLVALQGADEMPGGRAGRRASAILASASCT